MALESLGVMVFEREILDGIRNALALGLRDSENAEQEGRRVVRSGVRLAFVEYDGFLNFVVAQSFDKVGDFHRTHKVPR